MEAAGVPPAGPAAGGAASGGPAAGAKIDLNSASGGGAGGTCRGWVPSWPSALSTGGKSTGGSAQLRNSTPWTVSDPRCWKRCCPSCGCPEMGRPSPWQRFVDSAVRATSPPVPAQAPGRTACRCAPRPGRPLHRRPGHRSAHGGRPAALLVAAPFLPPRSGHRQRQAARPNHCCVRNRGQATAPDRPAPGAARPPRLGRRRRRRVAAAAGAGPGDRRTAPRLRPHCLPACAAGPGHARDLCRGAS